ncbi:hypothetical protein [Nocardiopsis ansamitocini]|uniref:Uncharacterized protein n=1 Tax=Nocardiopsis ansamitocini TaxID=1670832 RepID=A0A9W6P3B6_9ACTN|nr:hypothetical protein [Nocardiopsis ansamitocini]GLU46510.1 hypothetical protein Nans01_08610 [Nocardiopsis ansamitocini]
MPIHEHAAVFAGLPVVEFLTTESEISWIPRCDVSPLSGASPALDEFTVRGSAGLGFSPVRHETLRRSALQTGGLPGRVLRGVPAAELPAPHHLELWFGSREYGGDSTRADLAPLLDGALFPNLTSLVLRNADRTDELAAGRSRYPAGTE